MKTTMWLPTLQKLISASSIIVHLNNREANRTLNIIWSGTQLPNSQKSKYISLKVLSYFIGSRLPSREQRPRSAHPTTVSRHHSFLTLSCRWICPSSIIPNMEEITTCQEAWLCSECKPSLNLLDVWDPSVWTVSTFWHASNHQISRDLWQTGKQSRMPETICRSPLLQLFNDKYAIQIRRKLLDQYALNPINTRKHPALDVKGQDINHPGCHQDGNTAACRMPSSS